MEESFPLPGRYYHKGLLLFEAVPEDCVKALKRFQLQDGDVFVSGYPKTGTDYTEIQQRVGLLIATELRFTLYIWGRPIDHARLAEKSPRKDEKTLFWPPPISLV